MKYVMSCIGMVISLVCASMDKPHHVRVDDKSVKECMWLYHLAVSAHEQFQNDHDIPVESVEEAYARALKCFLGVKTKNDPELVQTQKKLKIGLAHIIALHKIENPTASVSPEITKLLHRASLMLHLQEYDSNGQKDRPAESFSSHYFKTKQNLNQMLKLSNQVIKNAHIESVSSATTAYFKGTYHHVKALELELHQPDSLELIEQLYITAFNSMLSAYEQGDETAREELEFIFEAIQALRQKIYQKNSAGYTIPSEYLEVCRAIKLIREKNPI